MKNGSPFGNLTENVFKSVFAVQIVKVTIKQGKKIISNEKKSKEYLAKIHSKYKSSLEV